MNRVNEDKTEWQAKKDDRVCSVHFVDKIPTVHNPDPSLNISNKKIYFIDPLPSKSQKIENAPVSQTEEQTIPQDMDAPLSFGNGRILFRDPPTLNSSQKKGNDPVPHTGEEAIPHDVVTPFIADHELYCRRKPKAIPQLPMDHDYYCNKNNVHLRNQKTEIAIPHPFPWDHQYYCRAKWFSTKEPIIYYQTNEILPNLFRSEIIKWQIKTC